MNVWPIPRNVSLNPHVYGAELFVCNPCITFLAQCDNEWATAVGCNPCAGTEDAGSRSRVLGVVVSVSKFCVSLSTDVSQKLL